MIRKNDFDNHHAEEEIVDGVIVTGLCLSPFLILEPHRPIPVQFVREIWKIICSMGAISLLSSFKMIGGYESLWGFRFRSKNLNRYRSQR